MATKSKLALVAAALVVLLAGTAWAVDVSDDSGSGKSTGKEKSQTLKSSIDDRTQTGTRTGSTSGSSRAIEISSQIDQIMSENMIAAEKAGKDDIFGSCRILSDVPQLAELGLSGDRGHYVDVSLQNYLSEKAKVGGSLPVGNTEKIKDYMSCLAEYGAIEAQALKYMGAVGKDAAAAASAAFEKAQKGVKDKRILATKAKIDAEIDKCTMKYAGGDMSRIQCGALQLQVPGQLRYGKLSVYGDGGAYGMVAVARAGSTAGSETVTYRETSAGSGTSYEASATQKKSTDKTKKASASASPSKMLPQTTN